ncbi:MAG: hypothetical protein OQK35_01770 [Alphaproteobacteria bacterium]|nr:hypothetical protein [Rhodospirillales bacterium]MCW9045036.1 hypothetical protein [Alphaproteobacteria bacterium]
MSNNPRKHKMSLGFIFGWLFVALAFIGAANEASLGSRGLVSAEELWYAKDPGSLIVSQIRVEKLLGPEFWSYSFGLFLAFPIWVIFGVPAALLLWVFRPHKEHVDFQQAEAAHEYADMLARMAKEEGAEDDSPGWVNLDEMDKSEHPEITNLNKSPLDHYMDQWVPEEVDDEDLEGLIQGDSKDIRRPGELGHEPPGIHDLGDLKLGDGKGRRTPGDMPDGGHDDK